MLAISSNSLFILQFVFWADIVRLLAKIRKKMAEMQEKGELFVFLFNYSYLRSIKPIKNYNYGNYLFIDYWMSGWFLCW